MSKRFFRNIEQLLRQIDSVAGDEQLLREILARLVESYSEPYGIESGRLYREREQDYLLIESIGEFGKAIAGKAISKSYPIVREIERERLVQISPDTPGFDPELEAQFSHLDNAAILVGRNPSYILSLSIRHHGSREDLLVMLETIRAAIGMKLRQYALEDMLLQARDIQLSLLPPRLPQLDGFELAAITIPAEEVGGDVYDVQRLDAETLSIMLADASGHGLPAALQARDVIIGLRMGVDKDEKITATIARLNRVIHSSGLASRFVSLFYAELNRDGDVFYVNCGHCPPLLIAADGQHCELPSSGPVLGPLPRARFRRQYARLRPGDLLVIYSDGIIERMAPGPDGEEPVEFGTEHLIEVCRTHRTSNARAIAQAVLDAVQKFGDDAPWQDDVSVCVIRHRRRARSSEHPNGGRRGQGAGRGNSGGSSPGSRSSR
jgi:serine phosphatase RsbU (regulator of sigma subunit)